MSTSLKPENVFRSQIRNTPKFYFIQETPHHILTDLEPEKVYTTIPTKFATKAVQNYSIKAKGDRGSVAYNGKESVAFMPGPTIKNNAYGSNVPSRKSQSERHILVIPKKFSSTAAELNEDTLRNMIITGLRAQNKYNSYKKKYNTNNKSNNNNNSTNNKNKYTKINFRKGYYNRIYVPSNNYERRSLNELLNIANSKEFRLAFHPAGMASVPYTHMHVVPTSWFTTPIKNGKTRNQIDPKYIYTARNLRKALKTTPKL